jgi:hypothetical protein
MEIGKSSPPGPTLTAEELLMMQTVLFIRQNK